MRTAAATYFLAIALSLFGLIKAHAQLQVKVITKTVEKSFNYNAGDALLINGEKSSVVLKAWEKNEVRVTLKLISKAISSNVASKELEYQKYTMDKKRGIINLSNYFELPEGKSLEAILLTEYEVWAPSHIILTINNNYGNIEVTGVKNSLTVTNRFGNTTLNKVEGNGKVKSYFGDFIAWKLSGDHSLELDKTKSMIDHVSGKLSISSQLGDITINHLQYPLTLDIEADKSDINLGSLADPEQFLVELKADFGKINIPDEIIGKANQKNSTRFWRYSGGGKSRINAKTSFGTISLSVK